jgi:UDP-N-acetylmuramate dehydrogenase
MMSDAVLMQLHDHFGERLQQNVRLAPYTTARVGGPARWFAAAASAEQLGQDADFLWKTALPYRVLGNGSNMLVSDDGWDGFVLLNMAKSISVNESGEHPTVYVESGAALTTLVRKTAEAGLSGLEWAAGIPGTVGGAVYGNAGAHGSDISKCLTLAEILHRTNGQLSLRGDELGFTYRSSSLKREPGNAVILSATFKLERSTCEAVQARVDAVNEKRRCAQPTGASFGSTFKNPAGDHAARLIEAAGLKGTRIGGVEVSPVHANFMINSGSGCAEDYRKLIELVRAAVLEKSSVALELEIELFGDWKK